MRMKTFVATALAIALAWAGPWTAWAGPGGGGGRSGGGGGGGGGARAGGGGGGGRGLGGGGGGGGGRSIGGGGSGGSSRSFGGGSSGAARSFGGGGNSFGGGGGRSLAAPSIRSAPSINRAPSISSAPSIRSAAPSIRSAAPSIIGNFNNGRSAGPSAAARIAAPSAASQLQRAAPTLSRSISPNVGNPSNVSSFLNRSGATSGNGNLSGNLGSGNLGSGRNIGNLANANGNLAGANVRTALGVNSPRASSGLSSALSRVNRANFEANQGLNRGLGPVSGTRNLNSLGGLNSVNSLNRSALYGGYGGYGRYPYGGYGGGYGGYGRYPYGGYGGYGGYPYGGYGYYGGYPWGIVASRLLPLLGYGLFSPYGGYGGYGGGYGVSNTYYVTQPVVETTPVLETPVVTPPLADPAQQPAVGSNAGLSQYMTQGEESFRAGNYDAALRDWRHAFVDDPNNPGIVLLMGQALFASGKYEDAAGAIQSALQALPQNEWGAVVSNYRDLYTGKAYADQVRALETSAAKSNSPAERFLLGYNYAFLGYPKESVRELDRTLAVAPKDDIARKLRDAMAEKAGLPKFSAVEAPAPEGN